MVIANRRIDNTPPSATMLSPGDPVRGTVGLTSNTSDGGSGIASVAYELAPHGGSFNSQPASWDTTQSADGLYDLRVTATDIGAVVPVHLTGHVANLPALAAIAAKRGWLLIEDAAHALGARYTVPAARLSSASCSWVSALPMIATLSVIPP